MTLNENLAGCYKFALNVVENIIQVTRLGVQEEQQIMGTELHIPTKN